MREFCELQFSMWYDMREQKTLWEKVKMIALSFPTFFSSSSSTRLRPYEVIWGKSRFICLIYLSRPFPTCDKLQQPVHLSMPGLLFTGIPAQFFPSHWLLSVIGGESRSSWWQVVHFTMESYWAPKWFQILCWRDEFIFGGPKVTKQISIHVFVRETNIFLLSV